MYEAVSTEGVNWGMFITFLEFQEFLEIIEILCCLNVADQDESESW